MTTDSYAQLLHRLTRLRTDDADSHQQAQSRLQVDADKVAQLRQTVEAERGEILETAARLAAGVPDLRATPDADHAATAELDQELHAAQAALTAATTSRQRAERAGQLPPLLPRGHHFVRNLIVYGGAMAACFVVQLILVALAAAGVISADLGLWIAFVPPMVFLIAGYVATGIAGTPRIPTYDARGNEVAFTVYKSPRLGACLAVLTIVGFFVWDLS